MNFHNSGLFDAFFLPCVDNTTKLQNIFESVFECEKHTEWWRFSDDL